MIIMPTMGRPHNLKRFIESYRATQASVPVCVVFDAADKTLPGYAELDWPANFIKTSVPAGTRVPAIQNAIFRQFPNLGFYGLIGDDCVPETRNWDVILAGACLYRQGIAWGFDSIQNERMATHPFLCGDLVRQIGWITPPHFTHYYGDTVITHIAQALNRDIYMPEVRTIHHHHMNGLAPDDATYQNLPPLQGDKTIYELFMKEDFPKIIQRVRG